MNNSKKYKPHFSNGKIDSIRVQKGTKTEFIPRINFIAEKPKDAPDISELIIEQIKTGNYPNRLHIKEDGLCHIMEDDVILESLTQIELRNKIQSNAKFQNVFLYSDIAKNTIQKNKIDIAETANYFEIIKGYLSALSAKQLLVFPLTIISISLFLSTVFDGCDFRIFEPSYEIDYSANKIEEQIKFHEQMLNRNFHPDVPQEMQIDPFGKMMFEEFVKELDIEKLSDEHKKRVKSLHTIINPK